MNYYQKWVLFLLCLYFPMITGCAAVALSGLTMGAGYSMVNVADRTSNFSMERVYYATILALSTMNISVIDDHESSGAREIKAGTGDLLIYIELRPITENTTKMSVNATKNFFIKDKSTAEAIITQTLFFLAEEPWVEEEKPGIFPVKQLWVHLRGIAPGVLPAS